MEAAFSYRPGQTLYGKSFTRATTANYVDSASDVGFLYWPGQLHATATHTRATTATYVNENKYPSGES